MDLLHVAVVALIRGITEFFPISPSGHLAALSLMTTSPNPSETVEVAIRFGTLCALLAYFWRDLWTMGVGLFRYFTGRRGSGGAHLAFQLMLGAVPGAVALALMFYTGFDRPYGLRVTAWAMVGFGVVLFLADRVGMTIRRVEHLAYADALLVGIAQALALIPGAGRAAITISAGRILGFERVDAARLSMLLAIPVLLGDLILQAAVVARVGLDPAIGGAILAGFLGFVAGLAAIAALMAWLRRSSFTPFVIYRILLGGTLLGVSYIWGVQ